MLYFLDTSALLKRYRKETGTETIDQIFHEARNRIAISAFSICEVARALDRHLQTKELGPEDFEKTLERFYSDLHSRRIAIVEMDRERLFRANMLIFQYHLTVGDSIILASALALQELKPIFVSSDLRSGLLQGAQACHLSILNPLTL